MKGSHARAFPLTLIFPGNTREAMTYYHSIFGGEFTISTFADFGVLPPDHPAAGNTMHSQIIASDGSVRIMAADYVEDLSPQVTFGNNVTMALSGTEAEILTSWFNALAEDGVVAIPLELAPWGGSLRGGYR